MLYCVQSQILILKSAIKTLLLSTQINHLDAVVCVGVLGRWSCRQNDEVAIYPVRPQPVTSEIVPDLRWIGLKDRVNAVREGELLADSLIRKSFCLNIMKLLGVIAYPCSTG